MAKDIILDGKVVGKKYDEVLPLGTIGESDDYGIKSPCVIYDNGIYKMWYNGFDGSRDKIFYATSENGIVWDKYGVVMATGITGNKIVDIDAPSVIYDGSTYKMWYKGYDDGHFRIYYATSEDGITWDKHGEVLPLGAKGTSDYMHIYYPSVIYDGSTYKMWYSGFSNSHARIHYATSTDGIKWTKHGVVVPLGIKGDTDDEETTTPYVIFDGTIYKMWYAGYDGIYCKFKIHYATSEDGINWDKHGIVAPLGIASGDYNTLTPSVIIDGSTYKIWYTRYDADNGRMHYAELSELGLPK